MFFVMKQSKDNYRVLLEDFQCCKKNDYKSISATPNIIAVGLNQLVFRLGILLQLHELVVAPLLRRVGLPDLLFGLLVLLRLLLVCRQAVVVLVEHALSRDILRTERRNPVMELVRKEKEKASADFTREQKTTLDNKNRY